MGASRPVSLLVVAATYLFAGVLAVLTSALLGGWHPLLVAFVADVVATVGVFAVSVVVANASVYDPYWSVAPPVVVCGWAAGAERLTPRGALVIALVLIWAVRLTTHWVNTWRGLGHEDWRYIQVRDATAGRLPWWLVNLTGIQLMPTVVVFLALLPGWPAVTMSRPLGIVDILATLVTAAAIAIETIADLQLRRFTSDSANRGLVADHGLWRYSRHPNYLGEIGFWCGIWLFGLAAEPRWWWSGLGVLVVVVLFVFASVPMMDRRSLARRAGYGQYMRVVPPLIPRPRATGARARW